MGGSRRETSHSSPKEPMKTCYNCKEHKPLDQFCKDATKKDGLKGTCKPCLKQRSKELYDLNPEARRKATNDSRNKLRNSDPEKYRRLAKNARLKSTYGITLDQYEAMLKEQEHSCAICGVHQGKLAKELAVDHCHTKGHVRKLLCHYCNTTLGLVKEDVEVLQNMINYLKPPVTA